MLADIRVIVDAQSQTDPQFKLTLIHIFLNSKKKSEAMGCKSVAPFRLSSSVFLREAACRVHSPLYPTMAASFGTFRLRCITMRRTFLPRDLCISVRGKRGRTGQTEAKNLLDALLQRTHQVLAFLDDLQTIPFTNNLVERDLRMAKVQQKVAGTFLVPPPPPVSVATCRLCTSKDALCLRLSRLSLLATLSPLLSLSLDLSSY